MTRRRKQVQDVQDYGLLTSDEEVPIKKTKVKTLVPLLIDFSDTENEGHKAPPPTSDDEQVEKKKESVFTKSERSAILDFIVQQNVDVKYDESDVSSDPEEQHTLLNSSRISGSGDRRSWFSSLVTEEKSRNKGAELFQLRSFDSDLEEDVDDDHVRLTVKVLGGGNGEYRESMLSIMVQVFIPFLIAGFGTVGAGLVLDYVQHWEVFQKVTEVFILVPALLGLKGNLEMTLASRLSTQANLGNLNTLSLQWKMTSGNMALIQCQATVVGFLAALFAIAVNWLPNADFNLQHALILCTASLLTACLASALLGIIMIIVVIISHKCNINPDNVATPIAASLGDLITLAILAQISSYLYNCLDNSEWVFPFTIAILLITIPLWCYIAHHNKYTNDVLYSGWTPVITAMAISSIGGCILDFAVSRFRGIAVFQPVINGVGGNLAAVQASRISTYLHKKYKLGQLARTEKQLCISPINTFFSNNIHSRTARVLLLLVVPGQLLFTYGIRLLQAGHTSMTAIFLFFYLTAAVIQVFILLYLAQIIIFWMWRHKIDPDNSAIPYLTALGDLIGTGLLAATFYILFAIGDKDGDVGD